MKNSDMLQDALCKVDPQLITDAAPGKVKRKAGTSARVGIGLIAACLAVALLSIPVIGIIMNKTPDVPPDVSSEGSLIPTICPGVISGSNKVDIIPDKSSSSQYDADTRTYFGMNPYDLILTAKATEVLPDVYRLYNLSTKFGMDFRLIKMRTLQSVSGYDLPDEFVYAIPEYLFVDLTKYETLLMSLKQIGFEDVLVCNETQRRNELMPMLFTSGSRLEFFAPQSGQIMPFNGSEYVGDIWSENPEWKYRYDNRSSVSDHFYFDEDADLVGAIAGVREFVEQYNDGYSKPKSKKVRYLDFKTDAAKEVLAYISEPGSTFAQCLVTDDYGGAQFIRYINDIPTNEVIYIGWETEEITRRGEALGSEDLVNLPDIATFIAALGEDYKNEIPAPPHITPTTEIPSSLFVDGWYKKVDGVVYGIVRVQWTYFDSTAWVSYIDQSFYLSSNEDDHIEAITREQLVGIIGEDPRIYMGEYDWGIAQAH